MNDTPFKDLGIGMIYFLVLMAVLLIHPIVAALVAAFIIGACMGSDHCWWGWGLVVTIPVGIVILINGGMPS